MKAHQVQQGTPEWLALRTGYFTASEASAMMGVSKYQTRSDLLKKKSTGIADDIDENTQRLFDRGHATEATARVIAEGIIGQDLYPATVTDDSDYLLASLDGMTMDDSIIFEHKLLNAELVADVKDGKCPERHYWQVVQSLLITGAEKCMFVVSDGTEENFHYCWVTLDPEDAAMLLGGWKQFEQDLKDYQHVDEAPKLVAAVVLDLPAVCVQVTGQLIVTNNFPAYEVALRDFIDNQLIRKPQTDQDFADLDAQIKSLKKAEEALNSEEARAIAQIVSMDEMKRHKDMLLKIARDNRLMAEKLLEAEKVNRRAAIIAEGTQAFADHVAAINADIAPLSMPVINAGFASVVKGLKSMDSAKSKVSTELARVKIEANRIADLIRTNQRSLRELANDHKFLFMDASQLVLKANDDLVAVIKSRIAEHEAAEKAKLDAERERIRAEEQAKAQAEQEAKALAETVVREAQERAQAEASAKAEAERQASIRAQMREQEAAEGMPQQEQAPKPVREPVPMVHSVTLERPILEPIRPSADYLIGVIAREFDVSRRQARDWLATTNFNETEAA